MIYFLVFQGHLKLTTQHETSENKNQAKDKVSFSLWFLNHKMSVYHLKNDIPYYREENSCTRHSVFFPSRLENFRWEWSSITSLFSEINGQMHVMSAAISQVVKVTSTINHLRFGDEPLG